MELQTDEGDIAFQLQFSALSPLMTLSYSAFPGAVMMILQRRQHISGVCPNRI